MRVTAATVLCSAGFIYLINHPRMYMSLPFLALLLIVLIEWLIVKPMDRLNKQLEALIDNDDLSTTSLKSLNKNLGPELKILLNPLFLTVSKIESEQLQNQEKAKDLQRWRAKKTEEQEFERQTMTTLSEAQERVTLSDYGATLVGDAKSFTVLASQVLEALEQHQGEDIKSAIFVRCRDQNKYSIAATLRLSEQQEQVVARLFANSNSQLRSINGVAVDIGPLSLKRYGLEELSQNTGSNRSLIIPIENNGLMLGLVICFVAREGAFKPEHLKQMEKFCHQLAPTFYKLDLRDAQQEQQDTDLLTGIKSRHYFNTLLTSTEALSKACDSDSRPVLLVIGLDLHLPQFAGIAEDIVDKWLPQLASTINEAIAENGDTNHQGKIHVCRFQSNLIAILIEQAKPDYVESLSNTILTKIGTRQWSQASSAMSAGIGICICQTKTNTDHSEVSSTSGAGLVSKALRALYFAQEKLGPGQRAWVSQVPPDYQPQRYAVIDGQLGVMDGFSLLQSIAATSKTGILTVTSDTGESFVSAWDYGKLTHAKMGPILGLDAIVEFAIFCDTGHFHFQQMQELPSIDEVGASTPNLGQALLTASLAADHFVTAQTNIPDLTAFYSVNQTGNKTSSQDMPAQEIWQIIDRDQEITSREASTARDLYEIFKAKSRSMAEAFAALDPDGQSNKYPPSLKLRAAFVLVKYQLIQLL